METKEDFHHLTSVKHVEYEDKIAFTLRHTGEVYSSCETRFQCRQEVREPEGETAYPRE